MFYLNDLSDWNFTEIWVLQNKIPNLPAVDPLPVLVKTRNMFANISKLNCSVNYNNYQYPFAVMSFNNNNLFSKQTNRDKHQYNPSILFLYRFLIMYI